MEKVGVASCSLVLWDGNSRGYPALPTGQRRKAGGMGRLGPPPYLRLHEAGNQGTAMLLATDFRPVRLRCLLSIPLVSGDDKNSHFCLRESVLKYAS